MVEPLIFVTTITLKEGKLEDFKHYSQQMGKFVEENEPRIIHFEQYINEEGTELTSVQIRSLEKRASGTLILPGSKRIARRSPRSAKSNASVASRSVCVATRCQGSCA